MKTAMVLAARAGRGVPLLAATVLLLAVGGTALAHELVRGSGGPDELSGDRHPNRVVGLGGDDTLRGRGGLDDLRGGEGNDVLRSGPSEPGSFGSRDVAFGGPGNDEFYGIVRAEQYDPAAVNHVYGGDGDDLYRANGSLARIASGGGGDDDLYGGAGNDELRGNGGADSLFAGGSCAFLPGAAEYADCEFLREPDNRLYGGGGDDGLHGADDPGEGDGDVLDGGEGRDVLDGGAGDDFELRGGPGEDTISGGAGDDTVYAQDGEKDEVDCGGDRHAGDTAHVDEGLDVVSNCEEQNPTTAP